MSVSGRSREIIDKSYSSIQINLDSKPRRPPEHPAPPWRENEWRYTKRLLSLLLEPSNDATRRALWPRKSDSPVEISKISVQTAVALIVLRDWEHANIVRANERWYGTRVKTWMFKLSKMYSECKSDPRKKHSLPVFSQLEALLGEGETASTDDVEAERQEQSINRSSKQATSSSLKAEADGEAPWKTNSKRRANKDALEPIKIKKQLSGSKKETRTLERSLQRINYTENENSGTSGREPVVTLPNPGDKIEVRGKTKVFTTEPSRNAVYSDSDDTETLLDSLTPRHSPAAEDLSPSSLLHSPCSPTQDENKIDYEKTFKSCLIEHHELMIIKEQRKSKEMELRYEMEIKKLDLEHQRRVSEIRKIELEKEREFELEKMRLQIKLAEVQASTRE